MTVFDVRPRTKICAGLKQLIGQWGFFSAIPHGELVGSPSDRPARAAEDLHSWHRLCLLGCG